MINSKLIAAIIGALSIVGTLLYILSLANL